MSWITAVGFLAAVCTTISYLPQMIKALQTKQTKDISSWTYIILATGLFLWFLYGLLLNNLPIIIANGITLLLAMTVLILKIRHG